MGLRVELGARAYDIHLGELRDVGAHLARLRTPGACVVVSNDVVAPLHGERLMQSLRRAGFSPRLVLLPDGEHNKTLQTWQDLVTELLESGVDRKTPIVALGGGVTGDIAGFAAASALRGLPLVQVPTTLLAMVDSSVGGKTGVNAAQGKNLIGAFYQPQMVVAALDTLSTLDAREFRCGLGEVAKHAILEGPEFLEWLELSAPALLRRERAVVEQAVLRCCRYKAEIVARDEREGGVRAWLNCGHTVGHAIERELGYGVLRHGEAVGLGLLAEAHICLLRGQCGPAWIQRIRALLSALSLPIVAPPGLDAQALVAATRFDKKRAHGILTAALPCAPGKVELSAVTPAELLFAANAVLPLEE